MEPYADSDCLICRKDRGQIVVPGGTIIEDDLLTAGHVQIRPGQTTAYLGYLMAEPKRHVPGLEGLTDEEAQTLGLLVARLSRALVATEGADHIYASVLRDAVPHAHVHGVARYPGAPEEFRTPRVDEWPQAPRGGPSEIEALCSRLRVWLGASGGA